MDWISTKDRMPENGETVLVVWKFGPDPAAWDIDIAEYGEGAGFLISNGYVAELEEIPCWLPIPCIPDYAKGS